MTERALSKHTHTCMDCGREWECPREHCRLERSVQCLECIDKEYKALEKRLRSSSNSTLRGKFEEHFKGPASKGPAIASTVFLLLALLDVWPYGFYTFLRLVVCGSAIYLALHAASIRKTRWVWLMSGTALLFNPLIPVFLPQFDWEVLDVIAAVIFLLSLRALCAVRMLHKLADYWDRREIEVHSGWVFWPIVVVTVSWFNVRTFQQHKT